MIHPRGNDLSNGENIILETEQTFQTWNYIADYKLLTICLFS